MALRLAALTDQTRIVSKPGPEQSYFFQISLACAEVLPVGHQCDFQWNGHPFSSCAGGCLETEGLVALLIESESM